MDFYNRIMPGGLRLEEQGSSVHREPPKPSEIQRAFLESWPRAEPRIRRHPSAPAAHARVKASLATGASETAPRGAQSREARASWSPSESVPEPAREGDAGARCGTLSLQENL